MARDVAIENQPYNLDCEVFGTDNLLNHAITYMWTKSSISDILGSQRTYTLVPTARNHGVTYHCAVTITSSVLSDPISMSESTILNVLGELYIHN